MGLLQQILLCSPCPEPSGAPPCAVAHPRGAPMPLGVTFTPNPCAGSASTTISRPSLAMKPRMLAISGTQQPFSMILGSTDISGGLQQLPPQWQGLGGRALSRTGPRPHPRATGIPGEPCPRPLCPQALAGLQEKGFSLCSSQPLAAATRRKEGQKPPGQVPAPAGTVPAGQWGQTLPRGRTKGLSKARVPAQPRSLSR